MAHQNSPQPSNTASRLWSWVDILMIAATSALVILAGTWLLSYLYPYPLDGQEHLSISYIAALTALEVVAIAAGVAIFGLLRKGLHWSDLGLVPASKRWITWAVIVTLIFIPVIGLIALAIQLLLGLPTENPQLEFLMPQDISWLGALIMVILGGVLVPIAEEILFRGVLYRWMRQFSSPWIAIPVSSVIFGLLHGDIAVAGATAVMGVILAWFYERSHSLWPSIAIHAVNNGLKLALLYGLLAAGINLPPIV